MSKQITVTCDGCNGEIRTTTGYQSEAYLELSNVWKGHTGNTVFAMSIPSSIDGTKHFHDVRCLQQYVSEERS